MTQLARSGLLDCVPDAADTAFMLLQHNIKIHWIKLNYDPDATHSRALRRLGAFVEISSHKKKLWKFYIRLRRNHPLSRLVRRHACRGNDRSSRRIKTDRAGSMLEKETNE